MKIKFWNYIVGEKNATFLFLPLSAWISWVRWQVCLFPTSSTIPTIRRRRARSTFSCLRILLTKSHQPLHVHHGSWKRQARLELTVTMRAMVMMTIAISSFRLLMSRCRFCQWHSALFGGSGICIFVFCWAYLEIRVFVCFLPQVAAKDIQGHTLWREDCCSVLGSQDNKLTFQEGSASQLVGWMHWLHWH